MQHVRIFFAGVGTTILLIGAGLAGGLMLAKTAMEPTAPTSNRFIASPSPPARVILPASAEAATPPEPSVASAPHQPGAIAPVPAAAPQVIQAKEVQQAPERDKQAERAERRKAEAEERERRERMADRKARREAARIAKQQHQQEQQQPRPQPGIVAFGGDYEQPRLGGGFFGN
ncbi:hypothetical protein [Bradyrhizobium australiense]|uniref:Uncharacterized protein n=1 Tax=Bradyrhizobium australiense TaxID=2721161 RepID=A0A7Y4LYJ0_9BRAD|nr:hypothetical protein [Bradyrhizobium australiense]NOJ43334.1 hypothetical protein [Bradyrhizobium australiense]